MDGSLVGEDFTLYIAAAWLISALALGGIAIWAITAWRGSAASERQHTDKTSS